jgi:hypothetical protein
MRLPDLERLSIRLDRLQPCSVSHVRGGLRAQLPRQVHALEFARVRALVLCQVDGVVVLLDRAGVGSGGAAPGVAQPTIAQSAARRSADLQHVLFIGRAERTG